MVAQEFGYKRKQRGLDRGAHFIWRPSLSLLVLLRELGSLGKAAQRSCTCRGGYATGRSSRSRKNSRKCKAKAQASPLGLLRSIDSTGIRSEDTLSRCGKRAASVCCTRAKSRWIIMWDRCLSFPESYGLQLGHQPMSVKGQPSVACQCKITVTFYLVGIIAFVISDVCMK